MDLEYAAKQGIAVFNSPFANSRSVAELVIAEIIILARQLGDRSMEMHRGSWNKVSSRCWEIRGKTLGKYPGWAYGELMAAAVKEGLLTIDSASSKASLDMDTSVPSCQY